MSRSELPSVLGAEDTEVLHVLQTEQARDGFDELDQWPIDDIVSALLAAEAEVPKIMAAVHPELTMAAEAVAEKLTSGGRLIYVGAGTPGRIALADAAECPPTYGVGPEVVIALTAAEASLRSDAYEAAEDDRSAAIAELERIAVTPADIVVGIAASGRTPFVVHALRHARAHGVATIAIANNPDSTIGGIADIAIELLTGAEVVSGSTRLTAGTSQKIALNIISTAAMVATGHTYGPWMTRMQAVNGKLRHRAARIVCGVTGASEKRAIEALALTDDDIELACLIVSHDLTADAARAHLSESADFRAAMRPLL
jgi:N-acetylmuramic acid 6-phosphate etherase